MTPAVRRVAAVAFVLFVVCCVLVHQAAKFAATVDDQPTPTSIPHAAPPTSLTATEPAPVFTGRPADAAPHDAVWDGLADCESGAWSRAGVPIAGTARWDDRRLPYEGGVHFTPSTWRAHGGLAFAAHAYAASRAEQIVVAERVLADQGSRAWPVCSRKVGLR